MRPSWPTARRASAAFAPASDAPTMTWSEDTGAPLGQGKKFGARARVVTDAAVQRRRDCHRAALLDAAQRHAHVLGLDHDADALRRELLVEPAGDLRRQALLDLKPAGEVIDDARELRQPDDAVAGEVADV